MQILRFFGIRKENQSAAEERAPLKNLGGLTCLIFQLSLINSKLLVYQCIAFSKFREADLGSQSGRDGGQIRRLGEENFAGRVRVGRMAQDLGDQVKASFNPCSPK